jgi:copper(I)-binding protein
MMPTASGIFMMIQNTDSADDQLVSGKSDACGSIEFHEMVTKTDGTMGMNVITDPIVIPAGGQLELKDGGKHIMCIQMKPDMFKVGSQINLTLTFAKAGDQMVRVDVRDK